MTDLEMIRLCAQAMGFRVTEMGPTAAVDDRWIQVYDGERNYYYDPLTDDEQAMGIVKRCYLSIGQDLNGDWCVIHSYSGGRPATVTRNKDLNRAIVECVAKAQAAK